MLVDTDVLIWLLRGNQKALLTLNKAENPQISSITYMELVQGMRDKNELLTLKSYFSQREISIIHLNEQISNHATFLMEQFFLGHNLQLADALIAATAIENGVTLLTGNFKHFKMIRSLKVLKFIHK